MVKLLERNLLSAEFARQSFRATPAAGTTVEDLLVPEYWTHVAKKFNPHDVIEVVPEDGSFFARLFVVDNANLWARVKLLEHFEFIAPAEAAKSAEKSKTIEAVIHDSPYEAKWCGPAGKWKALSKSNGDAISDESFSSRDLAELFIVNYSKRVA